MKKHHYVYIITNIKASTNKKYYIGVRTSICYPEDDHNYWGSCKDLSNDIINIGIDNFIKEILSTWPSRNTALNEEIRLHKLHNVSNNQLYYNNANQLSNGFDTTGKVAIIDIRDNVRKIVTKEEFYSHDYYVSIMKNRKFTDKAKASYSKCNSGPGNPKALKITIYDENNNLQYIFQGTFWKDVKKLGYPKDAFINSYRNNGTPIYQTNCGKGKARQRGYEKYIGWRAIMENIK